jgi:hypothetical protein
MYSYLQKDAAEISCLFYFCYGFNNWLALLTSVVPNICIEACSKFLECPLLRLRTLVDSWCLILEILNEIHLLSSSLLLLCILVIHCFVSFHVLLRVTVLMKNWNPSPKYFRRINVLTNRPFFDVNNQYTTLFYCGIWPIIAVVAYYFISFMFHSHLLSLFDMGTTNNSTTYHNTVQRNTAQYDTAEHIYQYYTQHPSSVFLRLFLLAVCSLSRVCSTIHNIIHISVNALILHELSGVVWFGVVRCVTENIVFHRHVCKSRCCDTMRFIKESFALHWCVL